MNPREQTEPVLDTIDALSDSVHALTESRLARVRPDWATCDAMIELCDRKSRDKLDIWHRLAGSVRKARTML